VKQTSNTTQTELTIRGTKLTINLLTGHNVLAASCMATRLGFNGAIRTKPLNGT